MENLNFKLLGAGGEHLVAVFGYEDGVFDADAAWVCTIDNAQEIDRSYEAIDERLRAIGADIERA